MLASLPRPRITGIGGNAVLPLLLIGLAARGRSLVGPRPRIAGIAGNAVLSLLLIGLAARGRSLVRVRLSKREIRAQHHDDSCNC